MFDVLDNRPHTAVAGERSANFHNKFTGLDITGNAGGRLKKKHFRYGGFSFYRTTDVCILTMDISFYYAGTTYYHTSLGYNRTLDGSVNTDVAIGLYFALDYRTGSDDVDGSVALTVTRTGNCRFVF